MTLLTVCLAVVQLMAVFEQHHTLGSAAYRLRHVAQQSGCEVAGPVVERVMASFSVASPLSQASKYSLLKTWSKIDQLIE